MDQPSQPATPPPEGAPAFETLLWEIFLRLMDVPADRVEAVILDAQRRLCRAFGLDRSSLWQVPHGGSRELLLTHMYDVEHDQPDGPSLDGSVTQGSGRAFLLSDGTSVRAPADASDYFPWTSAQVFSGQRVVIENVDDLPVEAARDAEAMEHFGTRATVIVPLMAYGELLGGLSFASTSGTRAWTPDLLETFRRLAEVFAKALARKRVDERLQAALGELQRLRDRLEHENVYLQGEIRERRNPAQIVGTSPAIRRVLDQIDQVAPTNATVLLTGETGTGKERVAAAIHELSPRRTRPMVKVNCSAIPATLIESELFGREKGAYTGALTKQVGRFELANGSTIFLDEIGDLPIETQAKLLRVIEAREFERLGSPRPVHVDVRIVAATNHDLDRAVREGRFREDLFFRLNVFPIRLPPLRERLEDLPLLAKALVDELSASMGRRVDGIARASLASLQRYPWPGNIRELRNIVERAIIGSDALVLHIDPPVSSARQAAGASRPLKAVERDHIVETLTQTGWRIRGPHGAAAILGLPPTTLENRMARLGITRPGRRLP